MAGLLETIARRLMAANEPKPKVRRGAKNTHTISYATPDGPTSVWIRTGSESHKDKSSTGESVTDKAVADKPVADVQSAGKETKDMPEMQTQAVTPDKIWVQNSTIDRTVKRERTNREVGKEDYLLNQIDEFREKAQQLQNLLLSKESKVAELQNIVDEREGKAKELEDILSERQRKADGITLEMTKQIDSLIDKVSAKMDEIGSSIGKTVDKELSENRQLSEKQLAGLNELKELLETINPQLETVKSDLSEKVHSENVKCFRNISDLFKSMEDKMDKISEVQQSVGSLRKCTIVILAISVINMLGLIAMILLELGLIQI